MGFLSGAIYAGTKMLIMPITEMGDKMVRIWKRLLRAQAHGDHEHETCMGVATPLGPVPALLHQGPVHNSKRFKMPPALTVFCLICNTGFDFLGTEPLAVPNCGEMGLPRRSPGRGEPLRAGGGRHGVVGGTQGLCSCPRASDDTE